MCTHTKGTLAPPVMDLLLAPYLLSLVPGLVPVITVELAQIASCASRPLLALLG